MSVEVDPEGSAAPSGAGDGSAASADADRTHAEAPGPLNRSPESFPREAFWNLPNSVTMLRIGIVPVLVFMPLAQGPAGSRFMAWAFIIAALTDMLPVERRRLYC